MFYLIDGKDKRFEFNEEPIRSNVNSPDSLPDIFLIVFDEFASSKSLFENLGFNNYSFDSTLLNQGFYVAHNSKSNYNSTYVSLSSMLNHDYIRNSDLDGTVENSEVMFGAIQSIYYSRVPRLLKEKGYKIINQSIFDLENYPTIGNVFFRQYPNMPFYISTFYGKVRKDIYWNFRALREENPDRTDVWSLARQNLQMLELTKQEITSSGTQPKFVYTHIVMPHSPFAFDSKGNLRSHAPFYSGQKYADSLYLDQVKFSTNLILEIADEIKNRRGRPLALMVLGDHGYRDDNIVQNRERQFQNLNTYYFSDGDYSQLYDSISPVNNFRVILNKYFKTNLPLLKDSTILIIPSSESL